MTARIRRILIHITAATPPDNLYEDINDWNLTGQYGSLRVYKKGADTSGANDPASDIMYAGSIIAKIKPYNNNGKATYQLLSLS